jgi:hypothetical protein
MNVIHLVLFDMDNRTFGSCLAAINRIPVRGKGALETHDTGYGRLSEDAMKCVAEDPGCMGSRHPDMRYVRGSRHPDMTCVRGFRHPDRDG